MKKKINNIYLALGSNIGNRYNNIITCIEHLKSTKGINIINCSKIYESKPMYFYKQNKFLNMVLEISTKHNPTSLLSIIKKIEQYMGRNLNEKRNHPRIIDIDILIYKNLIYSCEELTIPHYGLQDRIFVIKPLSDIAPNLLIPRINQTIKELMLLLDYNDDMIKLYKTN